MNRKANPLNYSICFSNTTNKGETCGVRGKRARPSALGHHIQGAPELLVRFQNEKRVPGLKKGRLQKSLTLIKQFCFLNNDSEPHVLDGALQAVHLLGLSDAVG